MAIIKPDKNSINYKSPEEHGHAESFIISEFEKLDENKTKDWVIYYSYSFKRENLEYKENRKDCEIDFLCLLPNLGIFVFEIKGGYISRENGEYYSTNKSGKNPIKDPYNQARNNYYDLIKMFKNEKINGTSLSEFVGGECVGFPDTKLNRVEINNLGDSKKEITYFKNNNLYDFFLNLSSLYQEYQFRKKLPSKKDLEEFEKKLVGKNFTYRYDLTDYLDTTNVRINQLTDEQFYVLDVARLNKRIVINGGAGTGKTILSEILFKSKVNEGEKVAYFCFNRFNAYRVKREISEEKLNKTGSIVMPILDYVDELANKLYSNDEELKTYEFDEKVSLIIDSDINNKFSTIIIDEAQDLNDIDTTLKFLNCLSSFDIKDEEYSGLKNGKYILFYDRKQAPENKKLLIDNPLFGDDTKDGFRYTKLSLYKNCRNTENIANKLEDYKIRINKHIEDLICNDIKYTLLSKDVFRIINIINDIIKHLKEERLSSKDIIILYNYLSKEKEFITSLTTQMKENGFASFETSSSEREIKYSTSRKYKGLESPIVIYLRINSKGNRYVVDNRINMDDYITVSRAKIRCYILDISDNCESKIKK